MTATVVFYAIGLLVGGFISALLVYLLGSLWIPSLMLPAILAIILGVLRFARPDSVALGGYKVPRDWGRWGLTGFLSSFGVLLGMGFVTTMPSPAMVALIVWTWRLHSLGLIAATFTAFSLGRLLTTLIARHSSSRSDQDVVTVTDTLVDKLSSVPRLEAAVSVALGVSLLFAFI